MGVRGVQEPDRRLCDSRALTWSVVSRGDSLEVTPISVALQVAQPAVSPPDLLVLQRTANLYKVVAYQPKGLIEVTPESIARADRAQAMAESSKFLELAMQNHASLVLAPEYSIPWGALVESLTAGTKPPTGCIWALGCESLPIGNIDQIRASLAGTAQVISEAVDHTEVSTQSYQNPLAYVFQTDKEDGSGTELIVLVQFKTRPSGDPHNTEPRGMLNGKQVYLFGQPGGIRLLTLICSDVFAFRDQDIEDYADGLLLLHLQLNNSPRDPQYRHYRTKLFGCNTRTELICLNWARGTSYRQLPDATQYPLVSFTGSAWYKKFKTGADTSDSRVARNDFKGLYFTWADGIKSVAYQFTDRSGVFCVNATKVFHGAGVLGAASQLTGPEMTAFFEWSNPHLVWQAIDRVDDDFTNRVQAAAPDLDELLPLHEVCPISVDRVATITCGEFGAEHWYHADRLMPLSLQDDTVIRRITSSLDEEGAEFRDSRLAAVRALAQLRGTNFQWPSEVSFLAGGFRINWLKESPDRNVYAESEGSLYSATVVYLGTTASTNSVDIKDQEIRHLLAGPLPDSGHVLTGKEKRDQQFEHLKRAMHVCILYVKAGAVVAWTQSYQVDYLRPSNTQDASVTAASFSRRARAKNEVE